MTTSFVRRRGDTYSEKGIQMKNRHQCGRMKIRAATGEFIQDQLKVTDDVNGENPSNVKENTPITLGNMLASAAAETELHIEANSNLFSSGHIVDPIANIYDFDIPPSVQSEGSDACEESDDDGYEITSLQRRRQRITLPGIKRSVFGSNGIAQETRSGGEVPKQPRDRRTRNCRMVFQKAKGLSTRMG